MNLAIAPELLGFAMFGAVFVLLMFGFPVAFTLLGTGTAFAFLGAALGVFDLQLLSALPLRIVGLMENDLLQAIPLFIYLGVILQRTTLAADLLNGLGAIFGKRAGGLGIATILISTLLAPTTGAVGATVLTIGLLALPSMLSAGYDKRLACGIVCSAGTLGTILPPSIVLILLGNFMQSAYIEAQLARGKAIAQAMTIQDVFLGAMVPVGVLLCFYLSYVAAMAIFRPATCPPVPEAQRQRLSAGRLIGTIVAPLGLLALMLALIITGLAYTVEAAATAALVTTIYALARRELDWKRMTETLHLVMRLTAMVFMLLMGASTFSLVFRGFSGDLFVEHLLSQVPGGISGAAAAVMAVCFGLGFFLDALEIIFLVVPIAMPPLLRLGADPIWLSILTAIDLQTAFLLPPFGFALFFLRGVAPREVKTIEIYRGVLPFIAIQIVMLALVWSHPRLVTYLPEEYGRPAPGTASTIKAGTMPPVSTFQEQDDLTNEFKQAPAQ